MVQWNHLCKNLTSQHFQVLLLTWPSVVLHCSREVKPEIDKVAHRYLKSTRLKREEWRCSDKLIDHWGSLDLFFFLKRDAQLTSLLPGCRITVTMKATKWMRPLYTSSRWYLWRHVHIQPMRSEEKQVSRLVVLTLLERTASVTGAHHTASWSFDAECSPWEVSVGATRAYCHRPLMFHVVVLF